MSVLDEVDCVDPLGVLSGFRQDLYGCLGRRSDALFELMDALLCTEGPVKTLVELSLAPEHRRGHGTLYGALNHGRLEVARLRRTLAGLPLPRAADGRIVLACDVSNWLRPDAATSPERLFCHTYGRGKGSAQMIPGWPYSIVAALEVGRTSWTALLDAVRLGPGDDETAVTATQLREVVERLRAAGHWREGDLPILIVLDAGYDVTRLAFLLADLPVELLGRMRSDRVLYFPPPPQPPGKVGRKPKRGAEFKFADAATWPEPAITTQTSTTRYGKAVAASWDRLHPLLSRRSAWADYPEGDLPAIEGTVVRLRVDHLPGDRDPKPVWLWWSRISATAADVDRLWQAFLRRFDLEHTFRMIKQTLGWTRPKLRTPEAADRWTWLVIAAHTQLRLARPLAEDLPRPWERSARPGRLSPARVRRGFRRLHGKTSQPAGAPKPGTAGPGRPAGSKNKHRAREHPVGKQSKTDTAKSASKRQAA
ncbi:NF041680 family putative transposase [Streptomyces chiangmaiensis]|uniref:NF041680 family putative transposase n=2 Tax=Streptomyces chiangmaiensis TaxID=766497 RepID=A0ABU7FXV1_9ACTN|nr:NF041680 family putative transposase [Streptomyces chiangmaiensis]MED7828869.1 NF041680 family putative transposase [Streptomyces chiangmaiensis]